LCSSATNTRATDELGWIVLIAGRGGARVLSTKVRLLTAVADIIWGAKEEVAANVWRQTESSNNEYREQSRAKTR
jgi:hypothetical protein